jgi:hypothetical protein
MDFLRFYFLYLKFLFERLYLKDWACQIFGSKKIPLGFVVAWFWA